MWLGSDNSEISGSQEISPTVAVLNCYLENSGWKLNRQYLGDNHSPYVRKKGRTKRWLPYRRPRNQTDRKHTTTVLPGLVVRLCHL